MWRHLRVVFALGAASGCSLLLSGSDDSNSAPDASFDAPDVAIDASPDAPLDAPTVETVMNVMQGAGSMTYSPAWETTHDRRFLFLSSAGGGTVNPTAAPAISLGSNAGGGGENRRTVEIYEIASAAPSVTVDVPNAVVANVVFVGATRARFLSVVQVVPGGGAGNCTVDKEINFTAAKGLLLGLVGFSNAMSVNQTSPPTDSVFETQSMGMSALGLVGDASSGSLEYICTQGTPTHVGISLEQ